MKRFIGLIVGVFLVVSGYNCVALASDTQYFKSGPFDTEVEYLDKARVARVTWTNKFENKQNRVIEVRYQFKVSYSNTVGYNSYDFTYLGPIHRVRVQPYSSATVNHIDYVPYSAIQNTWYSYCGWRWTANFSSELLDTR